MAFKRPKRDIKRVFLHCSASDNPAHDDVAVIRDWQVDGNAWSDVGYHYFIRKDGTVEPGRPLEKTPAPQAGNNTTTIVLCVHGLVKGASTKAQRRSLARLAEEIHAAYAGQISFHGHTEVSSKSGRYLTAESCWAWIGTAQWNSRTTKAPTSPTTGPVPRVPMPPSRFRQPHS